MPPELTKAPAPEGYLRALERLRSDPRMGAVRDTLWRRKRDRTRRFEFAANRGALFGYEAELARLSDDEAQEIAFARLLRDTAYAISIDLRVTGRRQLEDERARVAEAARILDAADAMALSRRTAAELREYEAELAHLLAPGNPLLAERQRGDVQKRGLEIAVHLSLERLFGSAMAGTTEIIVAVALGRAAKNP